MLAVTAPVPLVMLMQMARQGMMTAPPVEAVRALKPVATYHVAPATVYPAALGSSSEYSMLNVGVPEVTFAPTPILKGA